MSQRYVFDTDILTLYQRGHPNVVRNAQSRPLDRLAVTIISVEEQLSGWYTELRQAKKVVRLAQVYQRMTDAVRFLVHFNILTFAEPAIVRYQGLRAAPSPTGQGRLANRRHRPGRRRHAGDPQHQGLRANSRSAN